MVLKEKILAIAEAEAFDFADVDSLAKLRRMTRIWIFTLMRYLTCLWLMLKVKAAKFKVVVDGVKSGGIIIQNY
jgi:phosphomannomutase